MCGRYTHRLTWREIHDLYEITNEQPAQNVAARYNVAPTQQVPTVRLDEDGRRLAMMRWGLIPSWAKDEKIGAKMINARAETVAEKPAFRSAFKARRCLIVADGFFEWQKRESEPKQPYHITTKDGQPFAFAGLWESWKGPEGRVESCTIITTEANATLRSIHGRMPVMFDPEQFGDWLEPEQAADALQAMLRPYPAEGIEVRPISTRVNKVANDDPEILAHISQA